MCPPPKSWEIKVLFCPNTSFTHFSKYLFKWSKEYSLSFNNKLCLTKNVFNQEPNDEPGHPKHIKTTHEINFMQFEKKTRTNSYCRTAKPRSVGFKPWRHSFDIIRSGNHFSSAFIEPKKIKRTKFKTWSKPGWRPKNLLTNSFFLSKWLLRGLLIKFNAAGHSVP